MNEKIRQSIEEKKKQLDQLRPLPPAALERLRQQIVTEWTFNSNAIEGNTLTLKETALILNEGITISGKPLREHLEAVNHKDAILKLEEFVKKKAPLSEATIQALHEIIMKGIDDLEGGRYRFLRVRILGAFHIPPDPVKVPKLMRELVARVASQKESLHPVDLAAYVHHQLVYIHPFVDGNGRSARLAMNLILMQHGFPPAVVLKVDRRKYYRVLGEADQGKDENYKDFIARAVERSLVIYLHALTPTRSPLYEKQGYITLTDAAKGTPYSQEYLSLLARRGLLPATKFRRNWMTTRDAVKDYVKRYLKTG